MPVSWVEKAQLELSLWDKTSGSAGYSLSTKARRPKPAKVFGFTRLPKSETVTTGPGHLGAPVAHSV